MKRNRKHWVPLKPSRADFYSTAQLLMPGSSFKLKLVHQKYLTESQSLAAPITLLDHHRLFTELESQCRDWESGGPRQPPVGVKTSNKPGNSYCLSPEAIRDLLLYNSQAAMAVCTPLQKPEHTSAKRRTRSCKVLTTLMNYNWSAMVLRHTPSRHTDHQDQMHKHGRTKLQVAQKNSENRLIFFITSTLLPTVQPGFLSSLAAR